MSKQPGQIDDARVAELAAADWSNADIARELGCHEASVRRARKRLRIAAAPATKPAETGESEMHNPDGSATYVRFSDRPWKYEDYREFIREGGQDPDEVTFSYGWTSHPSGIGFFNKLQNVRPKQVGPGGAAWPVVQVADRVHVVTGWVPDKPARDGMKLALKCADTQIGFRALPDATFEAFHDDTAMAVFANVCRNEQPDKIQILGDMLDLPSQGKYAQEAGFARTTQLALNRAHEWLSTLRAYCPDAEIVIIEGNHDKRMQAFIEQNALAAFGLTIANKPESWPVMSIPNLLRLDELNIRYMDAYPAAADWDDDTTRNIHGTRANSKGSTMAQYGHESPHINTWAGHTHRQEIIWRTVIGPRGEAIESYQANPGALCHVDGRVPSVHGALHANGSSARVVEDWQQGFGSLLYGDDQSWPQVHRIRDGVAVYNGRTIKA